MKNFLRSKVAGWVLIVLLSISALLLLAISGVLFFTLATKTENRAVFSYHTENIYEETLSLPKKEVCAETSPDYGTNWSFFYGVCDNEKLHVVTSHVDVEHVTSPSLNYYFDFEEKSFINVSAKEGGVYYRFSKDASTARKFNETTCHEYKENFINITESPLQIFQEKGYYHICFDHGDSIRSKRSSFEMSVTEFYKDIPEQERMNCTFTNEDKKNKKCCRSFTRNKFCAYFFSGNSSFNPVTQLNSVTVSISYDDKLKVVPYLSIAIAVVVLIGTVLIIIGACCCTTKKKELKSFS